MLDGIGLYVHVLPADSVRLLMAFPIPASTGQWVLAGRGLLDDGGDCGRLREEDRVAGRYLGHLGARAL
jgi:hypothetical protein